MKIVFFLFFVFQVNNINALEIKVYSDAVANEAASKFINEFSKLEPFKTLLERRHLTISTEPLIIPIQCNGGAYGIARLAECNTDILAKICKKPDLCPIFTSTPDIGSGGDPFPIMSTSMPWTAMLHEVIHTYGFTDEYAYKKEEAPNYCAWEGQKTYEWENGYTTSEKLTNDYLSQSEAIAACLENIPWCKLVIEQGIQVVQKTADNKYIIGTPSPESCPSNKLGVYSGGSCQNQNRDKTFRPNYCPNIMGFPTLGEDYCNVLQRQVIIENMPNLIPAYYQKIIFDLIIKRSGISDESEFVPQLSELSAFTYGIPEVDELSPSGETINLCTGENIGMINRVMNEIHLGHSEISDTEENLKPSLYPVTSSSDSKSDSVIKE